VQGRRAAEAEAARKAAELAFQQRQAAAAAAAAEVARMRADDQQRAAQAAAARAEAERRKNDARCVDGGSCRLYSTHCNAWLVAGVGSNSIDLQKDKQSMCL
jgi:hypothetical protein